VLPKHLAQIRYEKCIFGIRLARRGEVTGVQNTIVYMDDGLARVERG